MAHPFVHAFDQAVPPPWEARSDWDAFNTVAERFTELAAKHLGVRRDLIRRAADPQYFGTLWSTSSDHAPMPPFTDFTYLKPCSRRKFSALSERTPPLQCR